MRYSGYIDNLLADAAYARKTGDASWLTRRLDYEEDPIKRMLLRLVCTPAFIESVKREGGWLRETKQRLEEIALDAMESDDYFNAEEINRHMQELLGNSDTKDEEKKDLLGLLGDEDEDDDNDDKRISESSDSETDDEDGGSGDEECDDAEQEKMTQWEQMRKNAMQKFSRAKEDNNAKDSEDTNDFEDEMSKQENPLFNKIGYGTEQVQQMECRLLSTIPRSLKKLARMIGRTGGFGVESGMSFSRAAKSDISGITVGDDLNSLLPTEVAMLSEKKTQDIFYRNYAEKRLQVFASASSGEKKVVRKDGPVIICLDTSSSMNGEPARVARMLTVAVAIYAMRRRRKVMIIKYSMGYSCDTFTRMGKDKDRLMEFLRWHGVGGNDENRMFSYLFEKRLPEEPAFDAADILCISDFGWAPLYDDVKQLIADAKVGGLKFYGLAVNLRDYLKSYGPDDSINVCDSKWVWQGNECIEI